jgi:hypothetical protein
MYQKLRKVWSKAKLFLRRLNFKQRLLLLGLLVVVIGAIVTLIIITHHTPQKSTRKVIYKAKDTEPQFSDPLIKIPAGAKSAVCDALPQAKVEALLGAATHGPQISIPNTANTDSTVSGCIYQVVDKSKSPVSYVGVVSRVVKDAATAREAYQRLTKGNGGPVKLSSGQGFYLEQANQLLVLKGKTVTTITAAKTTKNSTGIEKILTSVGELL